MSQLQLLVFDARRGNEEGEEADKILGFYPSSSDHENQIALAGLVQGLLMFTGAVLPEDSQDSHIIENDTSIWVINEAEPSIHLALLAGKSSLPRHVTQESLVGALRHIHHLMCLLFCSIQSLLDKDENAVLARSSIESVLKHAGNDLTDTTSWMNRELRNPYTAIGRAPMVTASTRTSLDVHSLCHRAQLVEVNGDRLIEDVVVVWKQAVLWSTLALADTGRLSSLLGSPILEPAITGTVPWPPSSASSSSFKAAKNLQQLASGFIVLRPEEGANENNNNSSQSDSAEGSHTLPFVYDRSSRLRHLLIYRTGQLMVMMLTKRGHEVFNSTSLEAVLSAIEGPAMQLVARITEESQQQGGELGHLPGWRFSVREEASVRASPRSKVSAMSHHARAVGAALADSLSRSHPSGIIISEGTDGQRESIEDGDVEVAVQSCYGAWAMARGDAATGRLSVVLREKRLDGGLAQSVGQLEKSVRSLELL